MSKGIVILGKIVFACVLSYLGFISSALFLVIRGSSIDGGASPLAKVFVLAGSIFAPAAGLYLVHLGRKRQAQK
jgi:hypothetical protein